MWPFSLLTSSRSPKAAVTSEAATQHLQAPPIEMGVPQDRFRAVHPPAIPVSSDPSGSFTFTGHPNTRLSIPLPLRLSFAALSSFTAGAVLGAAHGSQRAAFRYRAENAHRMPTTQTGWFLYQKSKNYHSALGGMKEGVKMGGLIMAWTCFFVLTEHTVDEAREKWFGEETKQRDVGSTVVAGMTIAGLYSWKKGMDRWTTAKTAKLALKWSVAFGVVQDGLAWIRGEPPAYVEWMLGKTRKIKGEKEGEVD